MPDSPWWDKVRADRDRALVRPLCIGCNRRPDDIREFATEAEHDGITADEWVRENEGSYNPDNGHFLCTECYVKRGAPSSHEGWRAP